MKRRTFLASLAAIPALSLLRPRFAEAQLPRGKDHARPHLHAAEPEPALQPEQHGRHGRDRHRDHRHRRRRLQGHARAVRRHAHRQESVPDRSDLAGDVHRLVLPAGPREDARAGRARSGALGHQGQSLEAAGARAARRHGAQLLRVLRHDGPRAAAGRAPAAKPRRRCADRCRRPRMEAGYRAFRMGAADAPDRQRLQHARARAPGDRRSARKSAKASARTATGASTSTSGSTSTTRCAPARHRGVRTVLRRRSGARRARAAGHPEAAADDDRAADARRGVGPALGLQQAGREPRHRLHPRDATQRRRHHRDDEDRGASARRTRSASSRTSPVRSRPPRWSTACRRSPGP